MKHYKVEGSVYALTAKLNTEFEELFPEEERSGDNQINDTAKEWIRENGRFLFHIYFV